MQVVIVTGAGGLVGAEAVRFYATRAAHVIGIDNDMRAQFFGAAASTRTHAAALARTFPNYRHEAVDIRDGAAIDRLFGRYGSAIGLVVHAAAQPSHDWAARDPGTDFSVNANGTLTLLEATRRHAPEAVFILTSTNKVYGDTPNRLPLEETATRWELAADHPFHARGIDETMGIDHTTHSLFGVSKTAGDLLAQEYGRYFGMRTGIFRAGCITGPGHAGARLHGFLAWLMKCAVTGTPYTIFGYKGKQVRDNIHAADLVSAFEQFRRAPRPGAVYNIGGSRFSHCSVLEAIAHCEAIVGRPMAYDYAPDNRIGDHIWWISDTAKFQAHYPDWRLTCDVPHILREIHDLNGARWRTAA